MDKIEMSLDDIIKQNKKTSGKNRRPGLSNKKTTSPNKTKKFGNGGILKGRGRGGIARSKYTRGDVNSAWKHDMYEGGRKLGGALALSTGGNRGVGGTTKLVVSNLDFSVSDSDINELFQEFGPLKAASVHYDRSGRSLGTADVIFERRNDALKAMKTYNGVPLDGRPMNILMATSEIASARVQRVPSFSTNKGGARSPRKPIGAGRKPFKRNFAGGAQKRGGGKKPEVTIDQLNAELDAYTMQS
ncbi:hypothetical protein PVAND_006769 [Polypedilum vanderplanki]|uniref:RRM domain-containing protein n=1 Tax=Polypedilum vanderplanki TaxID=319348 RepID=A0A9J6C4N2_POLVA|nr:hypothetical protein PVAND_006769 [Polypedilum vanderplanki]